MAAVDGWTLLNLREEQKEVTGVEDEEGLKRVRHPYEN
jgi:hypothetical protein